jgi:hypothetical protein
MMEAVVAGHRENHHPDSEGGIAQTVQNKRRKKDPDGDIDGQRRPAGANVFQDLPFFILPHGD